MVLYFNPHTEDGKVGVCSSLLSVRQPSGDAAGLYESFERAMVRVDVGSWKDKLVGFGCDGASVNVDSLFLVSSTPLGTISSGCLEKYIC